MLVSLLKFPPSSTSSFACLCACACVCLCEMCTLFARRQDGCVPCGVLNFGNSDNMDEYTVLAVFPSQHGCSVKLLKLISATLS